MTYHCWSSMVPCSASPSTITMLVASSCSSLIALRLSRAIVWVLRPVVLPRGAPSLVPGALVSRRSQPLEQQAEQLLEAEIDQAKEGAEPGRERDDDRRHVGGLARPRPVDLLNLALQIAKQADQPLPAP